MHAAPVVLYCALRVVGTLSWRATAQWVCLCGLAGAYFIPLHPVQTMLCGALLAGLAAAYALVVREGWQALGKLACAAGLGVAGAAWFWFPVLSDYGDLRITPHGAFLDAGLADAGVLLWPTYREAGSYTWPPQVGLQFVLAAMVALFIVRRTRAVGVVAAAVVLGVVGVVLFHERMPVVQKVLTPLQWSYRLLVPATLAGAVCLGLVVEAGIQRIGSARGRNLAAWLTLAYVLGTSAPYFLGVGKREYPVRVRNVVAPTWEAPNSTGSYALRGWDYRRLKLVRDDGLLNVNTDIVVPAEGVETEVELLLRQLPPGAATSVDEAPSIRLGSDPRRAGRVEAAGNGRLRVRFEVRPRVGHVAGDAVVRLDAPPGAAWAVEDLTFRAVADDPSIVCRIPAKAARRDRRRVTQFDVGVPPEREGWYQLPLFVLPSDEVEVNGEKAPVTPSANRAMVMVRLRSDRNVVKIRTLPTAWAWGVSALATTGMVVGVGVSVFKCKG